MSEAFDKCPKCGCDNISYGVRTFEQTEAWVDVTCENDKCDYHWYEIYTFSHNEDYITGEKI